jgi:hypothetical protein
VLSIEFKSVGEKLHIEVDGSLTVVQPKKNEDTGVYTYETDINDCIIAKIDQLPVSLFPNDLTVSGSYKSKQFDGIDYIALDKRNGILVAQCYLGLEIEQWSNSYTVEQLFERLSELLTGVGVIYDWNIEKDVEYIFLVKAIIKEGIIIDGVESLAAKFQIEHAKAVYQLTKEASANLITKLFQFPAPYQVTCSQYLLWFGELLQYHGNAAEVSNENKKGQT